MLLPECAEYLKLWEILWVCVGLAITSLNSTDEPSWLYKYNVFGRHLEIWDLWLICDYIDCNKYIFVNLDTNGSMYGAWTLTSYSQYQTIVQLIVLFIAFIVAFSNKNKYKFFIVIFMIALAGNAGITYLSIINWAMIIFQPYHLIRISLYYMIKIYNYSLMINSGASLPRPTGEIK